MMSSKLIEKVSAAAPLSIYSPSYVSPSGLTYTDLSEKIDKISTCASIVELKNTWPTGPVGSSGSGESSESYLEQVLAVSAANYCRQHAVCPVCADRSQSRRRARFNDSIKQQAAQVKDGKRHAYIVTYTVADGPDLSERLEHLKESKKVFRLKGQKRKCGRSLGEAGKMKAAISTIEIKRGSGSSQWHVHSHDLVFSDNPIDYHVYDQDKRRALLKKYGTEIPKEKLTEIAINTAMFNGEIVPMSKISLEWFAATGDSVGISVDKMYHVPKARTVYKNGRLVRENISEKIRRKLMAMTFEESIAYQSREVLKYISKPTENNPLDIIEIIDQTYNKRMTATYGEFRRVGGDDYIDPAAPGEDTFVLVWDDQRSEYGNPQPGKMRDLVENNEIEHNTRVKCGQLTGRYRRQRRSIVVGRNLYGNDLAIALDEAKSSYRAQVAALWSLCRQSKNASELLEKTGCDKYAHLTSVAGAYFPGLCHNDLVDMAWA